MERLGYKEPPLVVKVAIIQWAVITVSLTLLGLGLFYAVILPTILVGVALLGAWILP